MGRIEALTRALNSLRKVGIRTRTESEDGDGFGRWPGDGAADKQIGTSRATVYASLAGRNRASDVWRHKAQFDDDYQEFLAAQRDAAAPNEDDQPGRGMAEEGLDKGELTVDAQVRTTYQPQAGPQHQQQQKRKQKTPCKQRSQSYLDTEVSTKRWSRHSSVTLYAVDICDVRTPRQATPGPPPSLPSPQAPEHGSSIVRQSTTVSGGSSGGGSCRSSGRATGARQALPSPLGHVSRARTSMDNAVQLTWTGSGATETSRCGGGGSGAAAATAPCAALAANTTNVVSGLPSPSLFLRCNTSAAASDGSGSSCGGVGVGGSWSNSSCGGGGGVLSSGVTWSLHQSSSGPAGGGSSFRRQASMLSATAADSATAAAAAAAAEPGGACSTGASSAGTSSSASVVRLPSLRHMQSLSGFGRVLRPSTAAAAPNHAAGGGGAAAGGGCNAAGANNADGSIRQQHQYQPQPPPTQTSLYHQQQHQQQQAQKVVPMEQPRPPTAADDSDPRDVLNSPGCIREEQLRSGSGPASAAPYVSGRRAGSATGLPSYGSTPTYAAAATPLYSLAAPAALATPMPPPAAAVARVGSLSRGFSAQSLMALLASAGDSATSSFGSCGGGSSSGGRETSAGKIQQTEVGAAAAVAAGAAAAGTVRPAAAGILVANVDEAIPFDIVEGTGRWFDAGDLSYCNPDCDDEMAQILEDLVQSGKVGDSNTSSGGGGGGNSFSRDPGGRPQPGLSHTAAAGSAGGGAAAAGLNPSSRALVGLMASADSFKSVCSSEAVNAHLVDAGTLPAIQGSGSGGAAGAGRRGGGAFGGSVTGGSGGGGNGCGSGINRGSDSLLPRLPWSGMMYGSGGSGPPVSPSSISSPRASTRSFRRSSNTCANVGGNGALLAEMDTRALVEATEDVAAAAAASSSSSGMRHPTQSFRRSSQLLIQAAGRRASTGVPPYMLTAAAATGPAAAAAAGSFVPDSDLSRASPRGNSSGAAVEGR